MQPETIMHLQDLDLSKRYSYADYLTWQFDEMVELIRGKVFKMSPAPNRRHQEVASNLYGEIIPTFKGHDCKAFAAPFDVRLPQSGSKADADVFTVVQPDLCIICDRAKLDDRGCIGAPDLIIEILSPSTSQKDVNEKYDLYEQSGVKEYWIVDPANETLLPYTLTEEGTYRGGKLRARTDSIQSQFLPLQLALADVFAE